MARWRLNEKHYLVVPGTTYRHEETDRETGRRAIREFPVPMFVDPADPTCCNREGDCVVAYEGSAQRGDIVFVGQPTPAMDPLDEEAEKITEALRPTWLNPIETLPANGGLDQAAFLKELAAVMKGYSPSSAIPAAQGPSAAEFEALKKQLAEQSELLVKLTAEKPTVPARRPA